MGGGAVSGHLPWFRPVDLTRFMPPSSQVYTHAHSEYLEQASDLGLVGLFLFLWTVLVPVRAGLRALRRGERLSPWLAGLLAGMLLIGGLGVYSCRRVVSSPPVALLREL